MMTVDDSKLFKMFEELDPKTRKKALRGAFTRAAGKLKKAAEKNLKATKLKLGQSRKSKKFGVTEKDRLKQIRRLVYKRKALGFRITVGPKKKSLKQRMEDAEKRKGLPILLWAEGGTKQRKTETVSAWKIFRKRKGHRTGAMKAYHFMEETKAKEAPNVEKMLKDEIRKNVTRVARKYGCKVT